MGFGGVGCVCVYVEEGCRHWVEWDRGACNPSFSCCIHPYTMDSRAKFLRDNVPIARKYVEQDELRLKSEAAEKAARAKEVRLEGSGESADASVSVVLSECVHVVRDGACMYACMSVCVYIPLLTTLSCMRRCRCSQPGGG